MRLTDRSGTLELMVAQLGLVTRAQLLALGWREDVVDGAVRNGELSVVHRAVYRVPGSAQPPDQALLAAVLRAGAGARITGEAVLARLGIDELQDHTAGLVLLPPPRRLASAVVPWQRDRAPDHDHLTMGPVPATTAARAFVEIAERWRRKQRLNVIDQLRWKRQANEGEIVACARRLGPRHTGARAVLELAAAGKLDQESHGERDLAVMLEELRFPHAVKWQVWLSPLIRVDALIPALRVVLEYDGSDHHTHRRDREKDAARDREIEALGYRVIHLTKADLKDARTLRERLEDELGADLTELPIER